MKKEIKTIIILLITIIILFIATMIISLKEPSNNEIYSNNQEPSNGLIGIVRLPDNSITNSIIEN